MWPVAEMSPIMALVRRIEESLRAVPGLLSHVMDNLLVHKFRRAPFGSGRMFKACKETIAILLANMSQCQVLVEPFIQPIANDLGIEPSLEAVVKAVATTGDNH